MLYVSTLLLLTFARLCFSQANGPTEISGWLDGADLSTYVSEPDIRAPLLNLTIHDADGVTPGYWFMAPYGGLSSPETGREFAPYQIGPHIYDSKGELIWSGGRFTANRAAFDFRVQMIDGQPRISFILMSVRNKAITFHPEFTGTFMNSGYELVSTLDISRDFNMHELNVVDGGRSVLRSLSTTRKIDLSELGNAFQSVEAKLDDSGFVEVDWDNKTLFEWHPYDLLGLKPIAIRGLAVKGSQDPTRGTWDGYHVNSADKDEYGDYLVSLRYTNALYKISGKTGEIIWTLGGTDTDFVQDFNFTGQHHARFISSNSSVTLISFFDNASDHEGKLIDSASASAMKIVAVYENLNPKKAKIVREYYRPDGKLSRYRGAAQSLPNGGAFVCWSNMGYFSEFASDGRCVMEGRFQGIRFDSYRSFKFDWVGIPVSPPDLKTLAYPGGLFATSASSIFYVSWNGATEVASWSFFGAYHTAGPFRLLGNTPRTGFETAFIANGVWQYTYAEAFDKYGESLGNSKVGMTVTTETLSTGNASHVDYTVGLKGSSTEIALQIPKRVAALTAVIVIGFACFGVIAFGFCIWRLTRPVRGQQYLSIDATKDSSGGEELTYLQQVDSDSDEEEDLDAHGRN